jgi:soluble lytic murein transglycosylase
MKKKHRKGLTIFMIILVLVIIAAVCAITLVFKYYPTRYLDVIRENAEKYDLKPEMICAVINAESGFDSRAVSSVGASGLMQITEGTAYWLAEKMEIEDFDYTAIFDPGLNIRMGCFYLAMLYSQYGDMNTALCAYNAGGSNVNEWLQDPEHSSDGKTLYDIPFAETREHIKRIENRQRVYAIKLKIA